MNTPRTIAEYLEQLRAALSGADPALVQDALYDAEEHLRAELQEHPGMTQEQMLAKVVGSYGSPEEVAEIYRDQEIKIQRALRTPPPPRPRSLIGRFFGVAADARTWGAMFYMLLSLATGIFYFTWAVTGMSLSFGLSILIIGIPFIVLFFGTVRALSLIEGRIVEAMLGVRMPRRPPYPPTNGLSWLGRIGRMFSDARTWSTLLYMLLMLPLGICYFTITVTLMAVTVAFIGAPIAYLFGEQWTGYVTVDLGWGAHVPSMGDALILFVIGAMLLFVTLHVVRALGQLHGYIAKSLLVSRAN